MVLGLLEKMTPGLVFKGQLNLEMELVFLWKLLCLCGDCLPMFEPPI